MPRRRGVKTHRDPELEKLVGRDQKEVVRQRQNEVIARERRNQHWYVMYHAHGYFQQDIADITNRGAGLKPGDPDYVTDDTVMSVLRNMRQVS